MYCVSVDAVVRGLLRSHLTMTLRVGTLRSPLAVMGIAWDEWLLIHTSASAERANIIYGM
jgi:hypothetical protein